MKNTFKQAMCSVLALVMTLSALLGTTFAWFTDSATSSGNVIASGNLDAKMHWSDKLLAADSDEWQNADGTPVFNYNNWEPGYTEVRYVKVTNAGSLNFKWKLSIEAEGKVTDLSDVIDVYFVNPVTAELTKEGLADLTSAGTLTDVLDNNTGVDGRKLTPGSSAILAIAFHMDEDAGNEYQGKSLCEAGFALKLLATQDIGEYDSFDDQYDIDAEWPYSSIKYSVSQSIAEVIDTETGALTEDVTVGEITDDQYAEIPADVKLADGAESLTLKVESMEKPEADVTASTSKEVIRSVDVHIDGVAEDNIVPMLVTLKALFPVGITSNNVKLYHVENGATNEMTLVDNPVNHNEFSHDSNTGDVVISIASFSEIATIADVSNPWDGTTALKDWYNPELTEFTLINAEQFAGFRDLVDGGITFEGKTIKLGTNINLGDKNFDPIGWGYDYKAYNRNSADGKTFKGTFDGQGYNITNLYQDGWDLESTTGTDYTYTNCGGGLFASATNAVFKNFTIIHANIRYECVESGIVVGLAQGNCTFENIEIYDSKIANYQRPAGGIVGEVSSTFDANGNAIACTHNFKNIILDTSVIVGSLWGDFDTPVGGVIGARWDDANVSRVVMENVNVACVLDVYNDVTSTYQWYAYRRAGMLIGNTDTPPADGKTSKVATADFLTCSNVKVYYGDWAKYNYCEFSNYNSSWPWVRVQPSYNNSAYSNPRYGVPTDANGNRVVDYNHVHQDGDECNIRLDFNQLYGGGQGVYGQSEHAGVEFVKYLITFMHDDHIAGIEFVTNNSTEHSVTFPTITELDSSKYTWINYIGAEVTPGSEKVAAGNVRDVFYYVNETDYYYARFVDKDGIQIDAIRFDPKKGTFLDGLTAPDVPEIPGYNGVWEPYTLQGATADLIIDPVYTKGDITDTEILTMTTADKLFEYLSQGKSVSMSQDLGGSFGSANRKVFCEVVSDPHDGVIKEARFDLNSFELSYDGNNPSGKNWTMFRVLGGNKLTVGSGIAGFGTLTFNLLRSDKGQPCIFHLDKDATLVLERGIVIELHVPSSKVNSAIPFSGVLDYDDDTKYPGLDVDRVVENGIGIVRITVTSRTVLVGDGSDSREG